MLANIYNVSCPFPRPRPAEDETSQEDDIFQEGALVMDTDEEDDDEDWYVYIHVYNII